MLVMQILSDRLMLEPAGFGDVGHAYVSSSLQKLRCGLNMAEFNLQ